MGQFAKKTIIITGASRGIGREIAIKLASFGANIVLAAKTSTPHQFLEGTIHSVAEEVKEAGGSALAFQTDVRDEEAIDRLIEASVNEFGSIDAVINNAGAIYLTDTESTAPKQFDLMHGINVRATFLVSRAAIPHLKKQGGHILNLSPPINLDRKWLAPHVAYTMSKYGMSMCTLAMSEEFKDDNIAVNSLWPKTVIYTAAIRRLMGDESLRHCRTPAIMADAALFILSQNPREVSGNLFIDEDVIQRAGKQDLSFYNCVNDPELVSDIFVG